MAEHYLATYLNDHLAGSEVALELLGRLEEEYAGTPIGDFSRGLRSDIEEDREELESLMARLDIDRSLPRMATAWLSEKFADLKLKLDDQGGGPFRLLEVLEALSLGIEGKRSLWRALEQASDVNLAIRVMDYQSLQRRAEEQRNAVEKFRLGAAKEAFGSPPIAEKG